MGTDETAGDAGAAEDGPAGDLSDAHYRALAAFRYQIRRFQRFSEQAARDAGIEPQQHQALLALAGMPEGVKPTVGAVAERLQIRHHSAVELVDRLAERGLIARDRDTGDRRTVLLTPTVRGREVLHRLSLHHRAVLRAAAPELAATLTAIAGGRPGARPGALLAGAAGDRNAPAPCDAAGRRSTTRRTNKDQEG